jgi:hypothetical protein
MLEDWLEPGELKPDVETTVIDADVRQIRALLRVDCEFFIEFFLAESLDMSVPDFHTEIWSLLTDQEKQRVLLAIPRDHAKTTLAKLVTVWYWLFTTHRFCIYLSNTNPIAKGACKDIVGYLESDNFQSVFGGVKWIKQSENESLWIFEIELEPGKWKKCILRAVGQGQQMRGINIDNQRPDIAVVDDVEDNENTESEYQQAKLDKWIFGPFLKALARKKKIIWLGNMLAKTSLLARLSRVPQWNPVVFGALVKNELNGNLEALWPDKWTVTELQEDFAEYKAQGLIETWMCEMMNMPGHGENGFTSDQINYVPQPTPDMLRVAWISIDPAFGLHSYNDETSIAVHGLLKETSEPVTVCIEHGRFDEVDMFRRTLALAYYWNAWVWGIEAVAAQKVLISLFYMLLAGELLNHYVEILPLLSGKGDPKLGRIRAFVSLMAKREWGMYEGEFDFTTQLLSLDMRKRDQPDDIVDSVAYGPMMLEQYLPIIEAAAAGIDLNIDSSPRSEKDICSV